MAKEVIGQGRAGIVFQDRDESGNDIAIKVFTAGDSLTKLVNYFFTGAPNAYNWNEDAIKFAFYKRRVLEELLPYWTDSKVRIAKALDINWNEEFKAYELKTEFIDGRHASLHHPFSEERDKELSDLVKNVMKPLKNKSIEWGFDGLLWSDGYGNPTATANFMLEDDKKKKWVMIDPESGVPPFIPINPSLLLSFYIPKSIKHKRALFDDIDINKLREKIKIHKEELESKIGSERFLALCDNTDKLESHQKKWRSVRRAHRSITYRLKKEGINKKQADWYYKHPYMWYVREIARASGKGVVKLINLPAKSFDYLVLDVWYKMKHINPIKFSFWAPYRSEVVKYEGSRRVNAWEKRKQFKHDESEFLHNKIEKEATSPYLTDFVAHGLLKVFDFTAYPLLLGYLLSSGTIDYPTFGVLFFWGGSITRTTYTTSRMLYDLMKPNNLKKMPYNISQYFKGMYHTTRYEGIRKGLKYAGGEILKTRRLIALGIGMIPTIGSVAYPVQMVYSESTTDKEIGKFLSYDVFSRIGKKAPIYGCENSLAEHAFNHIPDLIVRKRKPLKPE